ncbi:MAG: Coenzyme F420 hydrogenase/dehydrogenase, beta subunit C-terminal domain [Candidatus Lokiarchaeota archaeon]|nr:Coenzyme F420 hydrogenase/dehydrogenase, beta subunit C-terminal domain [Candidatus Lokiarchaeota archaeon]
MKVEKSSQDLESEVIYAGLCIHCGCCNAFCPHMNFNEENGEAYVVDECAETVGLCYNSCPRSFLPISEMEQKMFGKTRIDLAVGVYNDIIQVKSKNKDEILYNLTVAAFDAGIVKHMVLSEPKSKKPPVAFPIVVDNAKDAKEYIPKATMDNAGPLITGIGQAYKAYKRDIGIIANPCHLQGLAKILVSDFNTGAERTSLKIAFACSSGGMTGCKYCTDFSGEFSDVSYSPWGAPKGSGEALLIIRTDIGQKLVDTAVKNKLIVITDPNPDLSEMKRFINKKRKKNFLTLIGKDLITAKYLNLNVDELKDMFEE